MAVQGGQGTSPYPAIQGDNNATCRMRAPPGNSSISCWLGFVQLRLHHRLGWPDFTLFFFFRETGLTSLPPLPAKPHAQTVLYRMEDGAYGGSIIELT